MQARGVVLLDDEARRAAAARAALRRYRRRGPRAPASCRGRACGGSARDGRPWRRCTRAARPAGHATRIAASSSACAWTAGREAVAREAPRAQPVREGADRLAGVGRRADPSLGLPGAAVEHEHALVQRRRAGRPHDDDLEPAGPRRPTRADRERRARPRAERDAADVGAPRPGPVEHDRVERGRLVGPQRRERVDDVQREVAEAADAGAGRVAHPRARAVEPAVDRARVRERRRHAREAPDQPLAQHAREPGERGELAQEQRRHRRGPAAADLARDAAGVRRGPRDRLLDEDRAPGPRGLDAQRRALVGRRADHGRVRPPDRGLRARHRGARRSRPGSPRGPRPTRRRAAGRARRRAPRGRRARGDGRSRAARRRSASAREYQIGVAGRFPGEPACARV